MRRSIGEASASCLYINAFALGRRTVIITSGALEFDDEALSGVFAHEFGHLANRDTGFLVLSMLGNLFLFPIFCILSVIAGFISGFLGYPHKLAGRALFWLLTLPQRAWTGLGALLILAAGRKAEFYADNYASSLGYKDGLLSFLKEISKQESDPGILGMLNSTHPATDTRIAKLMQTN